MQREVDGRGMEAMVDEALGDVEGAHAGLLPERPRGGHELVLAGARVGQLVRLAHALPQVVGGQHGVVAHLRAGPAPPCVRMYAYARTSTPTLPW